jgi:hypothetical protein
MVKAAHGRSHLPTLLALLATLLLFSAAWLTLSTTAEAASGISARD